MKIRDEGIVGNKAVDLAIDANAAREGMRAFVEKRLPVCTAT